MRIFISVGHHEDAKGAEYKGFNEYDEAKHWAGLILNSLGDLGVRVPLGTLKKKVSFINENASREDVAVEIHFNYAKNKDGEHIGRGSETLYYPSSVRGHEIGVAVQSVLSEVFKPDRGVKEGYYQMNKDKGPDFFLARTVCTSLIVEPDFIHRKEKIVSNRELGCEVIANALKDFVEGGE